MSSSIKIILADDHRIIRDGIRSILNQHPEFIITGEASDAAALMNLVETTEFDIILMDISMPGKNGIDFLKEYKKKNSGAKIIFLTMHEEPEYIIKGVKLGASGYLLKNLDHTELELALKTVYAGKKYFTPQVSAILMENLSNAEENEEVSDKLTDRELEVLREIVNGLASKQIGEKLFISSRTVDTHRVNLMRKLGVHNTAELVKLALEKNLI
ncbi:MAG: response regulator transcription factor [Cytophagaceae bacterium]|jgi:DNA-binding NarL/FixJ family response regulator|nr:response regulator transcription factor [Cytophagaceae bacterium]